MEFPLFPLPWDILSFLNKAQWGLCICQGKSQPLCNFPCICWNSVHTRVNFGLISSVDVSLVLAVPQRVCFCCNVLPGNLRSLLKIDFQTSLISNSLYCRKESHRKGSSIHWYSPTALLKLSFLLCILTLSRYPISLLSCLLTIFWESQSLFCLHISSPKGLSFKTACEVHKKPSLCLRSQFHFGPPWSKISLFYGSFIPPQAM